MPQVLRDRSVPLIETKHLQDATSIVGIGHREYADYCSTISYAKYFGDKVPIYEKSAVWKGITTNLKLDLIDNLKDAINGHLLYRRDKASSRLYICALNLADVTEFIEPVRALAYIMIKRSKSVVIVFYTTEIHITEKYIQNILIPRLDKIISPYTTQPQEIRDVYVSFSINSMDGANINSRRITCPTWNEIRNNYPYTNKEIDILFNLNSPDNYGKFIFWHGPPGTGKSYLIRAALQKWKNIVRCTYIVDPETFFNNARYMQEVILHRPSDADEDEETYMWYDDEEYLESPEGAKFRLLIIEDGLNNMLTETRYDREGAVSRFLNLTDGILGQGLRLLFIVTSNEKVTDIDPAFLRKGRCLQELEFPEFDKETAQKWIIDKAGKEKSPIILPEKEVPNYSLADLYSYISDDKILLSRKKAPKKLGF